MNNLYQVLDGLREQLLLSDFTNYVSFGEFSDIDIHKKTNFPLVHMVIDNTYIYENNIDFTINLTVCDIVNQEKEYPSDYFLGNDNLQDILATQLKVLTDIVNYFRRNDFVTDNYITLVEERVVANPFLERFENQLAGWEASIVLKSSMQDQC